MARLSLSERELELLRSGLSAAIDGVCIPDWEFEALVGCSRGRARRSLDAGLRSLERGARPSQPVCDRMLILLHSAHGASQGDVALEQLIDRLTVPERSPLESGVSLRHEVVPSRRKHG